MTASVLAPRPSPPRPPSPPDLAETVRIPVAPPRRVGTVLAVAAIAAVGLVLRVVPLRGLWSDEAISVAQARQPYWQMVEQLAALDVHPPMWASLLWLDVRLLGDGPLAVRVPSIVLGTASVVIAYSVGAELYDRRAGLGAAALTAVSPIAVWYSGEARMYAAYIFFSLLAILGQARMLRRPAWWAWALFGIASAALFYTQYFSVFQILTQNGFFAAVVVTRVVTKTFVARAHLVPWLCGSALALALVLPLLPVALQQLSGAEGPSGGNSGHELIAPYAVIANLVWALWGYHSDQIMLSTAALWPGAMLGVLLLLGKGRSLPTALLTALVLVPAACGYAVGSVVSTNMFELRYFIGVVPGLLILLARAATGWPRGRLRAALSLGAVAATMVVALVDQQFSSTNPRLYDYPGALDVVAAQAHPDDVLVYAPQFTSPVIDYYHPPIRVVTAGDDVPVTRGSGASVFVLGSFLDGPETAAAVGDVLARLEQDGWALHETVEKDNVTLWVLR